MGVIRSPRREAGHVKRGRTGPHRRALLLARNRPARPSGVRLQDGPDQLRSRRASACRCSTSPRPSPEVGLPKLRLRPGGPWAVERSGSARQRRAQRPARLPSVLVVAVGDQSGCRTALDAIPTTLTFWGLNPDEVSVIPYTESAGMAQYRRAWWTFMGTPDVGLTLTHKVLHHKRPAVFAPPRPPNRSPRCPPDRAWLTIHEQLTQCATTSSRNSSAGSKASRPSTTEPRSHVLRIHDIVLWCQVNESRWAAVHEHGREVLSRTAL